MKSILIFKKTNISRLHDEIFIENCLFITKYFNQALPKYFDNWFILTIPSYIPNSRWSNLVYLIKLSHNAILHERNLFKRNAIFAWNPAV